MIKLSIIIVNYNVKYFLRQLLQSITATNTTFDFEIIVVDNASTDGSVSFIRKEFPAIHLIANADNLGFSRANNIGIRSSKGEYVLLLNPDTILQEDTLQLCVTYLDQNEEAAALGCRMIDGSGNFLPESKRGFPSPRVALFKALGLSTIFPKSKYFNSYYLGHLPEMDIHEVDVLTGAFMLLRKSVLEEIGLLDEGFFMYGEDIDLSYRIRLAGHKVIYFPKTTIIHFKGESTQKLSATYVRRFYGAMQVFARKHYSGQRGFFLRIFLQIGIILRGTIALLGRYAKRFGPAILEWLLMVLLLKLFTVAWAHFYFHDIDYYAASKININIALYASIWSIALLMNGAYDQLFHWSRVLRGLLLGWVTIAAIYGFLGPLFRPSRSLVILSGPLSIGLILGLRVILFRLSRGFWPLGKGEQRRYAIVGPHKEAERIRKLVSGGKPKTIYVGHICNQLSKKNHGFLGEPEHLDQIVRFHHLNEVIFCSSTLPSSEIMSWMTRLGNKLKYKIAPDQTLGIIGSSSKNTSGELYTYDIKYQLADPFIVRNKRIFDILSAMVLFFSFPLTFWIVDDKRKFFLNIVEVLSGKMTWVSYGSRSANTLLPAIKPGVLVPAFISYREHSDEAKVDADYFYARDYTVWKDLSLVINHFNKLGS